MPDRFWPTSKFFWMILGPFMVAVFVGCGVYAASIAQETPTALRVDASMMTVASPVAADGYPNMMPNPLWFGEQTTTPDGTVVKFTSVDSTLNMATVELNDIPQAMFINQSIPSGNNKIIFRKDATNQFYIEIWYK